jgi:hypothetical protein
VPIAKNSDSNTDTNLMTDKPDGKPRSWGTRTWIAIAILGLYVLSIGPVVSLHSHGLISQSTRIVTDGLPGFL